jgi:hypothetical protein
MCRKRNVKSHSIAVGIDSITCFVIPTSFSEEMALTELKLAAQRERDCLVFRQSRASCDPGKAVTIYPRHLIVVYSVARIDSTKALDLSHAAGNSTKRPPAAFPIQRNCSNLPLKMKPRIGVLTSGELPGLNAVLRGVVLAAEKLGWEVVGFW